MARQARLPSAEAILPVLNIVEGNAVEGLWIRSLSAKLTLSLVVVLRTDEGACFDAKELEMAMA
jgi:hypothetical protein